MLLNFGSLRSPNDVRALHALHPETRLLVLANRPSPSECNQMLAFGATACLSKETQARDILSAVHLASRGLHVLPKTAREFGMTRMPGPELLKSVAIKAPGFGERRKAMLQDMAILTGGQVVSEEVGLKLENIGLELLGRARKVVVTKDETTIVEGAGSKSDVQGRINQIRNEIDNTDSDYDREKLQERLAKLSGGVAIIKVGAATEVELKEKKHRIEDAVQTTKAAVEEGVVPGGGVALLRAQAKVLELAATLDGDEATGAKMVARALEEPLKQIAVNAGLEGGVIVEKVQKPQGRATASTPPPASTRTW